MTQPELAYLNVALPLLLSQDFYGYIELFGVDAMKQLLPFYEQQGRKEDLIKIKYNIGKFILDQKLSCM